MSFLTFGAIGLLLEWVEVLGGVVSIWGQVEHEGSNMPGFPGKKRCHAGKSTFSFQSVIDLVSIPTHK